MNRKLRSKIYPMWIALPGALVYTVFFCSADYYCILLFLYELEFGPYGFTAVYRSSQLYQSVPG